MPDTSPILSLPYLAPAQAQKHVTVNEALTRLDILARLSVVAFAAEAPPETPEEGDVYTLGAAPTDDWAGQPPGTVAAFTGGAWLFLEPGLGWLAVARQTGELRAWAEGAWRAPPLGTAEAARLGVGATADASNPFAVAGPAALFTHAGAGHRIKVNKASATDTASLLFQTGWSGRAEMGLSGSDNWSIKVSADGASWTEALAIDVATGRASGAAVQASPADASPGKLMRADYGYGPATLVGAVSQAGGTPTGAAIETGTNGSGTWTRFADGTQICHHVGLSTASGAAATWTYPAAFSAAPAVTATPTSGATARIVTLGTRTATAVELHSFNISGGDAVSPSCDVVAHGRWF